MEIAKLIKAIIEFGSFEEAIEGEIVEEIAFDEELKEKINEKLASLDRRSGGFYEYEGLRVDSEGILYNIFYDKEYLYGNTGACWKSIYEPEEVT